MADNLVIATWLLFFATLFLAIATFFLVVHSRTQAKKSKLDVVDTEFRNVIEPIFTYICDDEKNNVTNSFSGFYFDDHIPSVNQDLYYRFWEPIIRNKFLCPTDTKNAIDNFLNSITTNLKGFNEESKEMENYLKARKELKEKIKTRYNELSTKREKIIKSL